MSKKKLGKIVVPKIVVPKPVKISLPTLLAEIQGRYRISMLAAYHQSARAP